MKPHLSHIPHDERSGLVEPEPAKRLSVNLPESLHIRFKTACSATKRKMASEILKFVEQRTAELEDEAGLSRGAWAGTDVISARLSGPAEVRLRAIDRALDCNHPTGDIDEMLTDIMRGRDLR